LLGIVIFVTPPLCLAEERIEKLEDIQVTAPRSEDIVVTPSTTIINVEAYKTPGTPQNITDILKNRAIIDFRGETDLVPDDDTIQMRGFSSKRFVTAIDGLTTRKAGGRKSSHIVDYALLPLWDIERIEILPGPHSALYPGKSIGGVINIITKTPRRYATLKPDINVSTSYQSYNTQNHNINLNGGVNSFVYGFGFQKYRTDGYLRNNEAEIDTVSGKLGYILPSDGYISLSASYTDADREIPVNNDTGDYDSDYPKVTTSAFDPWQKPTWDKEAESYRLNYKQPTPIGIWTLTGYYSKDNRDRSYPQYIDKKDPTKGIEDGSWETKWWNQGGKIQDEIKFSENHVTTIGYDMEQLYDGYGDTPGWSYPDPHDKKKRVEIKAGFLQHQWTIIPRLNLTAGLRYEDVDIWVTNYSSSSGAHYITGMPDWIKRNWDEWIPKSFLTYELDDISAVLRDTSVSLAVSKIWHAPDYHGDYNPQGKPTGAWLEPEHGVGYDFILARRLWNNVNLKMDYSFYEIKDYMASNSKYAKYTNTPGLEYSDYKINLEKVQRHGVEVELDGHLMDSLSFYINYAYQEFENKGGEPAGETELDDRAKHRVNAGLRYNLFENTLLMLDYKYQDEQVVHDAEETAPDEWVFRDVPMAAYHVFDFAVEQTLFKEKGSIKDAALKLYVKNLFDEDYENESGYPMTDQSFGIALSFGF